VEVAVAAQGDGRIALRVEGRRAASASPSADVQAARFDRGRRLADAPPSDSRSRRTVPIAAQTRWLIPRQGVTGGRAPAKQIKDTGVQPLPVGKGKPEDADMRGVPGGSAGPGGVVESTISMSAVPTGRVSLGACPTWLTGPTIPPKRCPASWSRGSSMKLDPRRRRGDRGGRRPHPRPTSSVARITAC